MRRSASGSPPLAGLGRAAFASAPFSPGSPARLPAPARCEWRLRRARGCIFSGRPGSGHSSHATRPDAAIAWEPEGGALRGLRFQLNVLNLGDARTCETVYTGHVIPGTGRTFVASVASRF